MEDVTGDALPVLSGRDWHELLCQGVPYCPGDLTNNPFHGAHSHMIAESWCGRSNQWPRICKKKKNYFCQQTVKLVPVQTVISLEPAPPMAGAESVAQEHSLHLA